MPATMAYNHERGYHGVDSGGPRPRCKRCPATALEHVARQSGRIALDALRDKRHVETIIYYVRIAARYALAAQKRPA